MGIIYDRDYGEMFEDPLEDVEDELDYETMTEGFVEGDMGSIESALEEVIAEGYHTICLITKRFEILDDIAKVADELGLVGPDYFWLITGDALPPSLLPTVRLEKGSPLDKMLNGAALFTNYDPFVYEPQGDAFLQEVWKTQDSAMVDRYCR